MKYLGPELANPICGVVSLEAVVASEPQNNSHKPLRTSRNLIFFYMEKCRGVVKNEKFFAVCHFEVISQCDIQL